MDRTVGPLRGLVERFEADHKSLLHFCDVPFSHRRQQRLTKFFRDWLDELRHVDFEPLAQDERIDYLLLQNHLRHELRRLEEERLRFDAVRDLLPFAATLIGWEEQRRELTPLAAEEVAAELSRIARELETLIASVEAGRNGETLPAGSPQPVRLDKPRARAAAEAASRLQHMLRHWHEFHDGYDPQASWWLKQPMMAAQQQLDKYIALLRAHYEPEELVGLPIGKDALLSELQYDMIPYSPEELIEIAKREFDWCRQQMVQAARDLGLADDWKKALDHVKSQHVAPGEQPELIRDLAQDAIRFLENHRLVTIPPLCRDTWRLEMMSPQTQKVTPFFTGGPTINVAYPTSDMTFDEKMMAMRGNNVHFARATVHHELIPGHHLQGFMADRYATHRRLFATPFFTEGWALHWEMLFWDMDYARSPENRLGMLFWRIHRCARIIFSLRYHLQQMSAEEAVRFLVDEVGHEPANAAAEVRRSISGDYAPLYQCAYMVGGLQLRALYQELTVSARMSPREFHDAVLRENAIPLVLVRASLMKQTLTRDFQPDWRFYPQ